MLLPHFTKHTATYCKTLQHNATLATHCNTLQHPATHCNIWQHAATHCNTLQHTATRCNTQCRELTRCGPPICQNCLYAYVFINSSLFENMCSYIYICTHQATANQVLHLWELSLVCMTGTFTGVCLCVSVGMYLCLRTYSSALLHTHTYTNTYIHTYIHT